MVAYFHGLESDPAGPKLKFLKDRYGDVYAPKMEYLKNTNLFHDTYEQLKNQKIDIIAGSSMGGYFAYYMAKKLGVETILFNPALPYRTFDPNVDTSGKRTPQQHIILGAADDVITPDDTIDWLMKHESRSDYGIQWGNHGHQTPLDVFIKAFKKYG